MNYSEELVWWKCSVKKCHIWRASIGNRTCKRCTYCPFCQNRRVCTTDQCNSLYYWCIENNRKELIDQWDEEKNGSMKNYLRGQDKKVWWKCPKRECHRWEAPPLSRTGNNKVINKIGLLQLN